MPSQTTLEKFATEVGAIVVGGIILAFFATAFNPATAMRFVICIVLLLILFELYRRLMEKIIRKEFDLRLKGETAKYKARVIDNQKDDLMDYEFILMKIFLAGLFVEKHIQPDDSEGHFENYTGLVVGFTKYLTHVHKTNDPSEAWDVLKKILMGTKIFWDDYLKKQEWVGMSKLLWGKDTPPKDLKEKSYLVGEYDAIVNNLKKYYPGQDLDYYLLQE
jgi:hypothetical protein